MITICKTPKGYLVNGKKVSFENEKFVFIDELRVEEETALHNFMNAEKEGIKIQRSCVTIH
jgi:hypothetical protein